MTGYDGKKKIRDFDFFGTKIIGKETSKGQAAS